MIRAQVPDSARAGLPAAVTALSGREQLVQLAGALVDHDQVTVCAAFDARLRGDGVLDPVRLVRPLELHGPARCGRRHDVPRDAIPAVGPEVRMQRRVQADRGLKRLRVRSHGQRIDALVPDVGTGEDPAPGNARHLDRRCALDGHTRGEHQRSSQRAHDGGAWQAPWGCRSHVRILGRGDRHRHPPLGLEGPATRRVWMPPDLTQADSGIIPHPVGHCGAEALDAPSTSTTSRPQLGRVSLAMGCARREQSTA